MSNSINKINFKSNGLQTDTINFSNVNIKKALEPYLKIQKKEIYSKILSERKKLKTINLLSDEFENLFYQEKQKKFSQEKISKKKYIDLNNFTFEKSRNLFKKNTKFMTSLKEKLKIKNIDLITNLDIKKLKINETTKNFHGKKILNNSNFTHNNRKKKLNNSTLNLNKSNKNFKTIYDNNTIKPYNFHKMFSMKIIKRNYPLNHNSINESNIEFNNHLIDKDLLFIKNMKLKKNIITKQIFKLKTRNFVNQIKKSSSTKKINLHESDSYIEKSLPYINKVSIEK